MARRRQFGATSTVWVSLLWYLLTGSYPVIGQSMDEIKRAHALGQNAKLQDARSAGSIAGIAAECLAIDPGKRPATAGEVGRRLRECIDPSRLRHRMSPRQWIALVVMLLLSLPVLLSLISAVSSFSGARDQVRLPKARAIASGADGSIQLVPVFSPETEPASLLVERIVQIEEAYRVAKLKHDIRTLDRILSRDYLGLNQYGERYNKRTVLQLFRGLPIESLVVNHATIRFNNGNTATVTGEQTEVKSEVNRYWHRRNDVYARIHPVRRRVAIAIQHAIPDPKSFATRASRQSRSCKIVFMRAPVRFGTRDSHGSGPRLRNAWVDRRP